MVGKNNKRKQTCPEEANSTSNQAYWEKKQVRKQKESGYRKQNWGSKQVCCQVRGIWKKQKEENSWKIENPTF